MLQLIKVDDQGSSIILTVKVPKRLFSYFINILDCLLGFARQLHWQAKCADATRKSFQAVHRITGDEHEKDVIGIRDEMILYLSEEGWSADAIGEVYDLTPGNVRQIRSRLRRKKITG